MRFGSNFLLNWLPWTANLRGESCYIVSENERFYVTSLINKNVMDNNWNLRLLL